MKKLEYKDLKPGMIVTNTLNVYKVYMEKYSSTLFLKNEKTGEVIKELEDKIDNDEISLYTIKETIFNELLFKIHTKEHLNKIESELLEISIKELSPTKIHAEQWTDTRCPNCQQTISKSHDDGYYSVKKINRCPFCNITFDWN